MLTEFLKSIRGEKALWETIITGVDVCNFRLQGNTKDPFIPISLQPLHFEVFFCFAGHVVLKQQWNRVVVVRKQEILYYLRYLHCIPSHVQRIWQEYWYP